MRNSFRAVAALALLCLGNSASAQEGTPAPAQEQESPARPIDSALAVRGKRVYDRFCVSCHGELGDGNGDSAQWLDPRPLDFTRGTFKCRSTPNGTLPTNDDLLRTVRNGIYNTSMPPMAVIGDRDQRAVIEYVKTFSPRWKEEPVGKPVAVAPEPPDDAASRKKGAEVYNEMACAKCHGTTGKGDGRSVQVLFDDWGHKIAPFDFTGGDHRKCGNTSAELWRTLMTGLNGSPMASFVDSLTPVEAWNLVHYLRTLQRK